MMNFEYYHWVNFFSQEEFKENFSNIKKKLDNKKVLLYCAGAYFEALDDCINLKENLSIVGISDIKFENENEEIREISKIQTKNIKTLDFDAVLVLSPDPKPKEEYLISLGVNKEKIYNLEFGNDSLMKKIKLLKEYLILTKDIKKGFRYFKNCTNSEFEVKINYRKVLDNLKNKKEKIRVLFLCEENQKWCYQNLYENLKKHPRFEVLPVALFPMITKNKINFTQKENQEFFNQKQIEAIDIYDYERNIIKDVSYMKPDIVFYQQPGHLFGFINPKNVSKYALCIMTPYGYTALSGKIWGSKLIKENYSHLWKFFAESDYHKFFYEKIANLKNKDIVLSTGYLKFDEYLKKDDEYNWKKPENPRIIYAPHHSITKDGLKLSTFKENYRFFLDFAKNHQEYSFVFKPHPSLKNTCIQDGFLTEEEFNNYADEWEKLENAQVFNTGDYFKIFKTSDLLITDCSSFLSEYYPTKKPIILLNRKDRGSFDEFGERIKKGFYMINSTQEIEFLINKLLIEKNDSLKMTRDLILKKEFNLSSTPISENFVKIIEKLIF